MNDRKQQVLITAKRIFVEKGFAPTSVQEILDEAKISKGTFYNYFSSKNECLIAILENGRDKTIIKRQELLIGQSKSDKTVLSNQISTRLQVNREHNLLPIFEAVFYSVDPDLRSFAKKQHLSELAWLSERLVDVYGEKAAPYSPDCAVLMMGMMQHMIHVWAARSADELDVVKLVAFAMRRIDALMADMIKTEDHLLDENVFNQLNSASNCSKTLSEKASKCLTEFNGLLDEETKDKNKETIAFLLDELKLKNPRTTLIEAIARSFREAFVGTSHERTTQEISACIYRYLEVINK